MCTVLGLDDDGTFTLSKGNTLRLTTSCSALLPKVYKPVYSYLLWLFPKVNTSTVTTAAANSDLLKVGFTVSIESESEKASKKRFVNAVWNKDSSCMLLDITSVLMKHDIVEDTSDETECTISISVRKVQPESDPALIEDQSEKCGVFADRDCSSPFLFLTHFDDMSQQHRPEDSAGNGYVSKRSIDGARGNESSSPCDRVELTVNMTELIADIVYPEITDIGMCSGACAYDSRQSIRHLIFEHLLQQPSSVLERGLKPCCSVDTMSTLTLLLATERGFVIEASLNTVVQSCKCGV